MSKKEAKRKIEEYEDFIENTLKVDLKEIETKLDEKSNDLKNWRDVKRVTKLFAIHRARMKTDLNVYSRLAQTAKGALFAKAEIKSTDTIHVKIGCNCVLQMDLQEAEKYADIRIKMVEKQIEHFRKLAVQVKVNIKLVLLAISELNPK